MDNKTKMLKGSPYRDAFKYWHKQLKAPLYAIDIDLALVEFQPAPDIRLVIDVKSPSDSNISATHRCGYDSLEASGTHVYFVSALEYNRVVCEHCGKVDIVIKPDSKVKITEYKTGKTEVVDTQGYIDWEMKWRKNPLDK